MSADRAAAFVDDARRYSELRWALVRAEGKAAKGRDWQKTQPREPGAVAGEWSRWGERWNIGVVCGTSGIAGIDVDIDPPCDPLEELKRLLRIDDLPATPLVRTGSGRILALFRDPGGLTFGEDKDEDGQGFELRVGARQCLLPPSVHPGTGRRYFWLVGFEPWTLPLLSLPEAAIEHFAALQRRNDGAAAPIGNVIPKGGRHRSLLSLAGTMRRRGMTGEEIAVSLAAVNKTRCDPPLDEVEVVELAHDIAHRYSPAANPEQRQLKREAKALLDEPGENPPQRERLLRGGAFILDQPADIPAVWRGAAGLGTAWAVGEGLMICGPDGVGKTSVMQQVSLGRIGLRERVLGMQLTDDGRPLLYLALDRPAQIARSFARMVSEADREVLDRRLIIWKGPPPFDIVKDPRALAGFVEEQGAGTVVIDSLKDLASKLGDDEVGGNVNAAFQETIERGIELLCGHHQRKQQTGAGPPKRLADVYGSRWLTAGMGSVFMLWGEAGDLEVECRHLKQPDEELGPWTLLHDHRAGKTVIADQVDLLELVTARGDEGITADQAAALIFDSATPSRNEVEKARRRLEKLTEQFLTRTGAKPDPVVYHRRRP